MAYDRTAYGPPLPPPAAAAMPGAKKHRHGTRSSSNSSTIGNGDAISLGTDLSRPPSSRSRSRSPSTFTYASQSQAPSYHYYNNPNIIVPHHHNQNDEDELTKNLDRMPLDQSVHPTYHHGDYQTKPVIADYMTGDPNMDEESFHEFYESPPKEDHYERGGRRTTTRSIGSRFRRRQQHSQHADDNRPRRRSLSLSRGRDTSANYEHGIAFVLPPNSLLSPRADIWIYLFLSSVISSASLSSNNSNSNDDNDGSSNSSSIQDTIAMTFLALLATLSGIVSIAFRYHPSMSVLTRPSPIIYNSFEMIFASLSFVLWSVGMAFYHAASSGSNYGGGGVVTANINAFFSLWIAGCFSSYLVADLATTNDCSGLVPFQKRPPPPPSSSSSSSSRQHRHQDGNNSISKLWTLQFLSSTSLFAHSISLQNGILCQGNVLQLTDFCSNALIGIASGIMGMLFASLYAVLARLHQIKSTSSTPYGDLASSGSCISASTKHVVGASFAILSFIMCAVHVGIVTSPGGPGATVGDLFVNSWISFLVAVSLLIQYIMEVCLTTTTTNINISGFSRFPRDSEEDERRRKQILMMNAHHSRGGTQSTDSIHDGDEVAMPQISRTLPPPPALPSLLPSAQQEITAVVGQESSDRQSRQRKKSRSRSGSRSRSQSRSRSGGGRKNDNNDSLLLQGAQESTSRRSRSGSRSRTGGKKKKKNDDRRHSRKSRSRSSSRSRPEQHMQLEYNVH